jgi:hypothetical protein
MGGLRDSADVKGFRAVPTADSIKSNTQVTVPINDLRRTEDIDRFAVVPTFLAVLLS